ncbi:MAG: coproporphyrinogen-III oxidase family protein [Planctomycetales bacterium]
MVTDTIGTTEVGNYFVANYPPFSLWRRDNVPEILAAFDRPANRDVPLGMYLHLPFCRSRCRYCYFRVYVGRNEQNIENYLRSVVREVEMLAARRGVERRSLKFLYIGGGTPSFLDSRQLRSLRDRLHRHISWDVADEVTFECGPGTLGLVKLRTLKEIGVTRISLGVQNFNDAILRANGRAYLSADVERDWESIAQVGFPQVNIDLIAGMVGETDENWSRCVEKAITLQPDNITIYPMEIPYNTILYREMSDRGLDAPVADWPTKRRWMNEAFDALLAHGYCISSGNELVRNLRTDRYVYRDNVWRGCDLLAVGVASFGHFQGVHYQNHDELADYVAAVDRSDFPINRALAPTPHQLLIREFVLQLKEGHVSAIPFRAKFGVDVLEEFAEPLRDLALAGHLEVDGDDIHLTRQGLLQVDALLPEFFEEEHRSVRYT